MNRKYITLALLPILAYYLSACSLQDLPVVGNFFKPKEPDPVTINIWGLWEDPQVMNAMIEKYKETKPYVTVNYEDRSVMSLPEYKERVFSRIQNSETDIDILLMHNTWVSRISGQLSPMPGSLMSTADYAGKYYPVVSQSAVVGGNIYAIPAYYDGLVLVYNRKHFEASNYTFPPETWEEFRPLALDLKVVDEDRTLVRAGAAIGGANNIDHYSDILGLLWAQSFIGYEPGYETRTDFSSGELYRRFVENLDSRPAAQALLFYTNFVKADGVWNETFPEATTAFVEGKVSMIFVPSWQVLDIIEAMSDPNEVGVAPVPQALADEPRTWGSFWMYAVPSGSQKQEIAWDFLNFLQQDENQQFYYNQASQKRFYGVPFASKVLYDGVSNPVVSAVLSQAPYAASYEIAGRSGNVRQDEAIKKAINALLEESGEVDEEKALEVLTELKSEIQY